MKNLSEMLRELARPGVAEFAVASDRLPCVKVGARYEPVDDKPRSTEAILAMLVTAGGSRYVEELERRPAAWTTRVDGVGAVGVQAMMREGRVQARFVLTQAAPATDPPSSRPRPQPAAQPKVEASPAAQTMPSHQFELASARAPAPAPAPAPSFAPTPASAFAPAPTSRRAPIAPIEVPELEQGISEPLLRAAVVKPSTPATPARLDALLSAAREAHASDLHLVAGRPMLLRIAGELLPRGAPIDDAAVEAMVRPIVPERLQATLAEHGSVDFALERGSVGRFRVNVSRQRTGLKACFRCIPAQVPTLASLGLPPEIERATHHHQGLVLVTGPTGHGKTTTLAAVVDIINRGTTHHVITVEDPVEYVHPRHRAMISQREVGTHTRSFANALKAALREDPDVIVVGELRDTETVRMALAASETGHLVLGTMNTPSAAKTIDRLVDLFPPGDQQQVRMTLAGGLHLIASQRLLPSADGQGMVAAVELLPGSVALWSLIRDAKTFQIPSLQQRGKGFGIVRLDDSLAELVRAGRVTRDAAMAVAENPDAFGKRGP